MKPKITPLIPIESKEPGYAELQEAMSIAINKWITVACMETELERWQVAANLLPTLLGTIAEALDEDNMKLAADHSMAIVKLFRSNRHVASFEKGFIPNAIKQGKSTWDVRF